MNRNKTERPDASDSGLQDEKRPATPETPPALDAPVKRIFAYGPSRKQRGSKSRTSD